MTNEVKTILAEKYREYLERNQLSSRKFAALSSIPENYLSAIVNDKDFILASDKKKVFIQVRYYKILAKHIGYKLEKEYWQVQQTPQLWQVMSYLEDAREFGYTNVLIGETGCGKTFISDMFVKFNIKEVFKVTVGSMDTIGDLLDKTCDVLKIETSASKSKKIKEIITKLQDMRLDGYEPMLIFDEAEYLKQATLCNMKELTDHLKGKAAVVLIGTSQLVNKIEQLRKKDKDGIPQFYSRIKLGIRHIRPIDTKFPEFMKNIEDKDLQKYIEKEITDYRQLSDLLIPIMREADKLGVPVNFELVKRYHGL